MVRHLAKFLLLCISFLLWTNVLLSQDGAASDFTPEEYEVISSAIDQYNLENPDRQIKELNKESLEMLINGGYLSEPADTEKDQLPSEKQPGLDGKSEEKNSISRLSRESFEGTIEKSSNLLSEQSPKSKGNPSINPSLGIDKKTITIKVNDQYKDVTIFAPQVPKTSSKWINGKTRNARKTILQEQIKRKSRLRPINRKVKPIQRTKPVPTTLEQPVREPSQPQKPDESPSNL